MNRHREHWSAMGYEPSEGESQRARERREIRECLIMYSNLLGIDEVITEIRKIKLGEIDEK